MRRRFRIPPDPRSIQRGRIVRRTHHRRALPSLGSRHEPASLASPHRGAIQALGDLAAIRRNYLVEDYRRDATNQNVIASVHVEASWDRAALSRLVSKGLSNTQGRSANRLNLLTPTSARRQV